ncbi:MAG: tyrosine-type recombinase/integrase [Wenzhouxiangella sp.]|nr:tyrosine-type recombinase/integrase [Wenzhouxiangella sp.]TVR96623.1 MAG: hypothetical protein EA418_05005 [Wenzhouxiangellaceae bacterium]
MVELREQDPARLIGRMRQLLNDRGFSDNVQKAWLFWARQFIEFHQAQGQTQPTAPDVRAFLGDCARQRQLTAAGRRQVLRAVRCLLEDVLGLQLDGLRELEGELLRDAGPILLSPTQVQELLSTLEGSDWLLASLVYGAGLRLMETVRLRIRDIEPDRILVRDANGRLGRETVLPMRVREPIRAHLEELKLRHIRELAEGYGGVRLPPGLRAAPGTARSWLWQFVFPGPCHVNPLLPDVPPVRDHVPEAEARQTIEAAARDAGLGPGVSAATLRNSFAAHLIQRGVAVADVERLLGIESPGSQRALSPRSGPDPIESPVDTLTAH